jgi:hypothetical protein
VHLDITATSKAPNLVVNLIAVVASPARWVPDSRERRTGPARHRNGPHARCDLGQLRHAMAEHSAKLLLHMQHKGRRRVPERICQTLTFTTLDAVFVIDLNSASTMNLVIPSAPSAGD